MYAAKYSISIFRCNSYFYGPGEDVSAPPPGARIYVFNYYIKNAQFKDDLKNGITQIEINNHKDILKLNKHISKEEYEEFKNIKNCEDVIYIFLSNISSLPTDMNFPNLECIDCSENHQLDNLPDNMNLSNLLEFNTNNISWSAAPSFAVIIPIDFICFGKGFLLEK